MIAGGATLDEAVDDLAWPGMTCASVGGAATPAARFEMDDEMATPMLEQMSRPAPPPPREVIEKMLQRALWCWHDLAAHHAAARWFHLHSCLVRCRQGAAWLRSRERAAEASYRGPPTDELDEHARQLNLATHLSRWHARVAAAFDAATAYELAGVGSDQRRSHAALGKVAEAAQLRQHERELDVRAEAARLASALKLLHTRCVRRERALRTGRAHPALVTASAHATTAAAAAAATAAGLALPRCAPPLSNSRAAFGRDGVDAAATVAADGSRELVSWALAELPPVSTHGHAQGRHHHQPHNNQHQHHRRRHHHHDHHQEQDSASGSDEPRAARRQLDYLGRALPAPVAHAAHLHRRHQQSRHADPHPAPLPSHHHHHHYQQRHRQHHQLGGHSPAPPPSPQRAPAFGRAEDEHETVVRRADPSSPFHHLALRTASSGRVFATPAPRAPPAAARRFLLRRRLAVWRAAAARLARLGRAYEDLAAAARWVVRRHAVRRWRRAASAVARADFFGLLAARARLAAAVRLWRRRAAALATASSAVVYALAPWAAAVRDPPRAALRRLWRRWRVRHVRLISPACRAR